MLIFSILLFNFFIYIILTIINRRKTHHKLPTQFNTEIEMLTGDRWEILSKLESELHCHSYSIHHPKSVKKLIEEHIQISNQVEGGIITLFTVQQNLFTGCLSDLLDKNNLHQVHLLESILKGKTRGCFGLTEKASGVLSGLIIEAKLEHICGNYILNTNEKSNKVWISCAGDPKVTYALIIAKRNRYPVIMIVKIRNEDGSPIEGVEISTEEYQSQQLFKENMFGTLIFNNYVVDKNLILTPTEGTESTKNVFLRIAKRLFVGRLAFTSIALHLAQKSFIRIIHPSILKDKMCYGFVKDKILRWNTMYINMKKKLDSAVNELDYVFENKLDVLKELEFKINYLKAGIMFNCVQLMSDLRIISGASQILASNRLIDIQQMVYFGFLAEGDAVIMAQSSMKIIFSQPWLALEFNYGYFNFLHSSLLFLRTTYLAILLKLSFKPLDTWNKHQTYIVDLFLDVFNFEMNL
jgi:hypothetical protein